MTSPLPSVQVLVAFNNSACDDPGLITSVAAAGSTTAPGALGAANVWTDISTMVDGYTLSRGRQHELSQFEAGTCLFDLNNEGGWFSPWNTSSPYYGFLLPRKLVQIRVTWSATVYKRFTGHVDAWPTVWADQFSNMAQMHATDAFRMFNLADITTGGYPSQVIADGATAYWRLGDPVGSTTAMDSSGNGYTGQMVGTYSFGQVGPLLANPGTGCSFMPSGSSPTAYATVPAAAAPSGTSYSIEAWVNSPAWSDGEGMVLQWTDSSGDDGVFWVDASGHINFSVTLAATQLSVRTTSATVGVNGWHHLAVTRSGATVVVYLDGVSEALTVASSNNVTFTAGACYLGWDSGPNFVGAMEEVAVYGSTVLSGTQVLNHISLATFPQEGTGARITRVLNAINWSSGARQLDTGYSTVQAQTQSLTTTSSLSHMQDVECTEGGALYMDVAGKVMFLSRQTLFGNALYTTSQATIGDNTAGGDLPFQPAPTMGLDDIDLYNEAAATRQNGNTQITDNASSITAYGRVTWSPPATLIGISDTEVLNLTQYIVQKYDTPVERLASITVNLLELITPNTVGTLLTLDLLQRVTVERTVVPGGGSGFSTVLNIEHITETVTVNSWMVEFATAVADPAWWILGTSQLGTNTRLAY